MAKLFSVRGVIAGFSRRQDGNMSLAYGDTAGSLDNRKNFLKTIDCPFDSLVCCQQTHSNTVVFVDNKDKGKGALRHEDGFVSCDALVTKTAGLTLAIFTADCLSVFLYDPRQRAAGLVHAGWKGTREKIAIRAIEVMRQKCGSRAQDILAGFGPALGKCCYEVGPEFNDYFPQSTYNKGPRFYFDLAAENRSQVRSLGIKESAIEDCGICTSCKNSEYFSYRKESKICGRLVSVIMVA